MDKRLKAVVAGIAALVAIKQFIDALNG